MIKYNAKLIKNKDFLTAWRWLNSTPNQRLKIKTKLWYSKLLETPRDSYLLGELPLGTSAEQKMYLHLSSMRNYFDYIETREAVLPLFLALDKYSKLQILTNRLLTVKDEKIYFKNEV